MARLTRLATLAAALLLASSATYTAARAQDPLTTYSDAFELRFDRTQPVLRYLVRATTTDSLGYTVELSVRDGPDTLRLASPVWAPGAYRIANFYRFVKNVQASESGRTIPVARQDSSTWRVVTRGGDVTVRYEIRYPTPEAAAGLGNYSFFRSDGALLSGPMTYLYVVGYKLAPVRVSFDLPAGWKIATGLVPTSDPRTFTAPSYDVLADSPVLTGNLRIWPFQVDGVQHRIAYYSRGMTPFDSVAWTAMHQRIVRTSRDIMGRLPYREYTFIYEDGPGGGLEHLNSATMSARSRSLARDPNATAGLTAHEFFHLWNVKRVRPVELGPFAYDRPVRTVNLWWAEGMTDFFASEINRRAGLNAEQQAREELASTIESYLNNPGHDKVSPERASWTAWDPATVNGGYNMSYYITGSLLGEMLELQLRDATGGARGVDDVERRLFDNFAGPRGYTGKDILRVVNNVCGCDMQSFFMRYVGGSETFDFNRYLALAGWRLASTTVTTDSTGRQLADVRGSITSFAGVGSLGSYIGSPARLQISDPNGSFGRAGLVDGDFVRTVNGKPVSNNDDFRAALAGAKVGDRYRVDYVRAGKAASTTVTILPARTLRVTIVDLPAVTARQRVMRRVWYSGPERVAGDRAAR